MNPGGVSANPFYEEHQKNHPEYPFFFHLDTVYGSSFGSHWHENIELLFFVEGSATVFSDHTPAYVGPGDLAVINSDRIHFISAENQSCTYYCLIMDRAFTDQLEIPLDRVQFSPAVSDQRIRSIFQRIIDEYAVRGPYYKQAVKAQAAELLVELCRRFSVPADMAPLKGEMRQSDIVKAGISLIHRRFQQDIALDDICGEIGYSKYYFSRLFRKYTGRSVMGYLQLYRCEYAQKLLRSGAFNVSQAARSCGIPNLSHFSKLYRRYFGMNPSEEKALSKENP